MSHGTWNPWKLTAIAMGLVIVAALATAAVVADWSGRQGAQSLSAATRSSVAAPLSPDASPPSAPIPAPTVPTQTVVDACNQYAAAEVGRRDKTIGVVAGVQVGSGAPVGAAQARATGAPVEGGTGRGKGAAVGGVVQAGGGTLYGVDDHKQHDRRYREAYAACMRGRGFRI